MPARCSKMTTKQLVSRAEREAGRKLTAAERKSFDLMPPQFDCARSGATSLGRSSRRKRRG